MKKRFQSPLATLFAFALLIPTFVFAQQGQSPAKRGDLSGSPPRSSSGGNSSEGRLTVRRSGTNSGALEALEQDFTEALTLIEDNYVDGNKVDYNNVFKSSIIGMLRTLDPHSNFYDAKEFEEMRTDWRSEYYGIGATISTRRLGDSADTYILATFENTPAARAGLRFGDRIVEVDGQSMKGKVSDEVRDKLRGPRGSTVKVTVERAATGNKETLEIVRDAVGSPTVPDAYMIRPGIGYIDMQRQFNYTTAEEFQHALESLKARGMTSLVIDLRNNGGGLLDQAVKVASNFLQRDQVVLSQKGRGARGGGNKEYKAMNDGRPDTSPLVVLVNRNTASASEIVAGALQDHDRALIVGETTFGKGLVQSIMPLDYGTALTLTTTKYYTPSGRLIQRDYSNSSLYDYYTRGQGVGGGEEEEEAEPPAKPTGPQSLTDTGRTVYGGGGIMPDDAVKSRQINRPQFRLMDPIFAFVRELVNGRISGFDSYKVQRAIDFDHELTPQDFPVDEKVFKAFKDFVASKKEYSKITPAQLDRSRDFIQRQIRYDIVMAAYGSTAATRVLVLDDPQMAKAIEVLPRARELAAAALRGRNPQQKSYE